MALLTRASFSIRGTAFSRVCRLGQDQLGVDRLDIALRADLAVHMHDVVILERPDHLADRVCLTDVGQELVAQSLTLGGATDDAGNVDEGHRCRHQTLAVEQLDQHIEARVGQGHHADVGLDRRERVVRREHVVLGQGVEKRALADVGQADDADSECHKDRSLVAIEDVCRHAPHARALAPHLWSARRSSRTSSSSKGTPVVGNNRWPSRSTR